MYRLSSKRGACTNVRAIRQTSFPNKMIQIGCKSPLLKHVVSFRRFVFMVLKDNNEELDLTFNFKHGEFNYAIFATTIT